ncbi:MAG: hypothetical protein RLZZ420_2011 [Bacteroidota bacterium]|jgi:hypothetical protein
MKYRLEESSFPDFFEDSYIVGIVSTLKNYLFCWHIQHHLNIYFGTSEDMQINLVKNQRTYSFTVYEYSDPVSLDQYQLFTNKNDGEFLLPELQHLDYIWFFKRINGSLQNFQRIQILLKSIPGVQMVVQIDQSKIKSKNNLQR